jgi:hypothetical protein
VLNATDRARHGEELDPARPLELGPWQAAVVALA